MKQQEKNKEVAEFQLADIGPIVLTLVIAGVVVALGLNVMGDVKDDFVTGGAACNSTQTDGCGASYNATNDAIIGVTKVSSKFGIIGTAVAFVIILGVIGGLFSVSRMGK